MPTIKGKLTLWERIKKFFSITPTVVQTGNTAQTIAGGNIYIGTDSTTRLRSVSVPRPNPAHGAPKPPKHRPVGKPTGLSASYGKPSPTPASGPTPDYAMSLLLLSQFQNANQPAVIPPVFDSGRGGDFGGGGASGAWDEPSAPTPAPEPVYSTPAPSPSYSPSPSPSYDYGSSSSSSSSSSYDSGSSYSSSDSSSSSSSSFD